MRFISFCLILSLIVLGHADAQDPVTLPDGDDYTWTEFASGMIQTVSLKHAGDGSGRLFAVGQFGDIWVIHEGGAVNQFMNIARQSVQDGTERGLLDIEFHPDYAANGEFFLHYQNLLGDTHLSRFRVSEISPDIGDPGTEEILLTIEQPRDDHKGGQLKFGPDGMLYMAVGDGNWSYDAGNYGQRTDVLLGKMLRIDVDSGDPYAVPDDNPFVGREGHMPEIWAYGLRNPWRFSFDRVTGDLYIADVGQGTWEEINFQPADSPGGQNYGWKWYEGARLHDYEAAEVPHMAPVGDPPADVTMPALEYPHDEGMCSVTGGYVYRGAALPELDGIYFYGDFCTGRVWAASRDASGEWQNTLFTDTTFTITSFGEDEAGELYLVAYNGIVYRLEGR